MVNEPTMAELLDIEKELLSSTQNEEVDKKLQAIRVQMSRISKAGKDEKTTLHNI